MPTSVPKNPVSERARVSVLVPTYRRSEDLRRCLAALERQNRPPDQVVIVCRDGDNETRDLLDSLVTTSLPLEVATVSRSGLVAALNVGIEKVTGDIVAITDDDAAPRADWLTRIEEHFARDPEVGGVGGRDVIADVRAQPGKRRVGVLQWFGRPVGNHHRGIGPARRVNVLKGVNMSYRMAAVGEHRFDERLRGSGAQIHNDLAFSLAMHGRGWRLIYDPAVAVDHYPAQRFDEDQRTVRTPQTIEDRAYNETLSILEYLPRWRHPFFWIWAVAVGTRELPGVLHCLRLPPTRPPAWQRLKYVNAGRSAARTALQTPSRKRSRSGRIASKS